MEELETLEPQCFLSSDRNVSFAVHTETKAGIGQILRDW